MRAPIVVESSNTIPSVSQVNKAPCSTEHQQLANPKTRAFPCNYSHLTPKLIEAVSSLS